MCKEPTKEQFDAMVNKFNEGKTCERIRDVSGDKDASNPSAQSYDDKYNLLSSMLGGQHPSPTLNMMDYYKQNHMFYYDANALYPWGMMKPLPSGEMEWDKDLVYERSMQVTYPEEVSLEPSTYPLHGFIYEVDLEYPDSIKEQTMYYPFCPDKLTPKEEWFSTS